MSWSASINKRLKFFSTRSKDQRKHHSFRFARNSSNLLNNEISHRTASKFLSQEQLHEISLELRWSLYLKSKFSVSLLQWHLSSMHWSSHHSIYQWINSSISSHATSESASMTFILNAMIYSLSSFYSLVNLIIHSHATSESATMMSSKSISSISKLISESASMILSMQ